MHPDFGKYEDPDPLAYKAVQYNFVELVRPSTGSRIEYELPRAMSKDEAIMLIGMYMRGWKIQSYSVH